MMNPWISVLPEILVLVLALVILILEPFWKVENRRGLGWLTAGGLVVIILISLFVARPAEPTTVLGGMIRFDWLAFFFKMLFLAGGAATSLLMMDVERLNHRGEGYILLLVSLLGMDLMAGSANLIMLFLAIETASIPLYILAGFLRTDDRSVEAGFKYLLFGVLTSTIMLYGFSLLFGFAGSADIYELGRLTASGAVPSGLVLGLILLIIVGLGFKVTLVPFHFWVPDVYEGAPTPVTGFLSTISKAAGFAVILRFFVVVFPVDAQNWSMIFAVLAAVTMTLGNLLALAQKNIKRMLAYSSIAHAGYTLIGVAAIFSADEVHSSFGVTSVIFYLIAYILTNLLAFGVVVAFARVSGSDEIPSYNGLSRRHPALALGMLAAMLSLSGMPPFGGFVAKVVVFAAAMKVGLTWLVVAGILNSAIGLYYYLIVLKHIYLYRDEKSEGQVFPVSRSYAIALVGLAIGVILLGTVFAPWFGFSDAAALNLF